MAGKVWERDLDRSLVEPIQEFLMELGYGFAFLSSQPVTVKNKAPWPLPSWIKLRTTNKRYE